MVMTRRGKMHFWFYIWVVVLLSNHFWGCSNGTQVKEEAQGVADGGEEKEQPPVKLKASYDLKEKDLYPEGITFDPEGRAFYIGSLTKPQITKIETSGVEKIFATFQEHSTTTLGMKVDANRRRLWICGRQKKKTATGWIFLFDVDSGKQLKALPIDKIAPKGFCNDLALDDKGNVYITDPTQPQIYRIDGATFEGKIFSQHTFFKPGLPQLGLNGIAVTPDGKGLLTVTYSPSRLYYVPIVAPNAPKRVSLKASLSGPDGLIFLDGKLYISTNEQIYQITFPSEVWDKGTLKAAKFKTGLSTATIAEHHLYVVKSEVFAFAFKQPPKLPFQILRVDLSIFEN